MANASYNRQHLATHAAGFINGDGTTSFGFGCQMTRLSAGHYALLLDANAGLIDDESFTQVQVKGTAAAIASVEDTSNVVKTILTFDSVDYLTDTTIEVALFKSVTKS